MSVIKAKNSNGEWEVVASAINTSITATGSLKTTVVQAATDNTFDLSSYVVPGANFFLFFRAKIGNSDTGVYYCWVNDRQELRNATVNTPSTLPGSELCSPSDVDRSEWIVGTYDNENRVLTLTTHPDNPNDTWETTVQSGILYYAG